VIQGPELRVPVFPTPEVDLGHLEPGLLSVAHNEHLKKETQNYLSILGNSTDLLKQKRLLF
jgi:hypothetical protein